MEKKTYILIYDRFRRKTGELMHYSTMGVYLLSEEELTALDTKLTNTCSRINSTRTDGLVEHLFFKETEITPSEQAEDVIKEAFNEQRIKLNL